MTRAFLGGRSLHAIAGIAAVYAVSLYLLGTGTVYEAPGVLSAAIAFDLTVTTPLVVWWLGVRRAGWPRWTIGAAFGVGLLVGRTALPSAVVATAVVAAWMAVEVLLVAFAVTRIRTVVRVARAHAGPGPVAKIEAGFRAAGAPARLAAFAATDVVTVWLGLAGWFRRAPRDGFAMHRRKSVTAIVMVFLALVLIESLAVHLIVAAWWSPIAAWILTALSLYGALWLSAHLHALRLYPVRVTHDAVLGSIGLHWRFAIPRATIASVELVDAMPDDALKAYLVEPTVVIRTTAPFEVRGLFGMRRTPTAIALTIDEPERLIDALARGRG